MFKKISALILPVILFCTFQTKADVPPDPGYVRANLDLVVKTDEDLSDYRFFLDFYGDLREVEVKSKGETVIPSMGGGARYRSGTFLAIPKKSLSDFDENLDGDERGKLSQMLKDKKIAGATELAIHQFVKDVPKGETPEKSYYKITREKDSLKAEQVKEAKTDSKQTSQIAGSNSHFGLIGGGIFITLTVLFAGIFAFRKASKKV